MTAWRKYESRFCINCRMTSCAGLLKSLLKMLKTLEYEALAVTDIGRGQHSVPMNMKAGFHFGMIICVKNETISHCLDRRCGIKAGNTKYSIQTRDGTTLFGGFGMKKVAAFILAVLMLTGSAGAVTVLENEDIIITAPSAVLMERASGELIYQKDAHTQRPPASVTKVMTLLLVMEALESGDLALEDMVSCSARAASMGGSQIWLEEGEELSASDMIKAVCVVSANDCAVALAEHLAGSEESFVSRMNKRAAELGMKDSNFVDCTGLTDNEAHVTSAYDIALMSRELLAHEKIKEYSTIWMDTLRGGESELTNTNKLVRFYSGATGLKTGFTTRAMYCLSASAERDGTEFIAVVMHCQTSTERFEDAKALLNYAFANYTSVSLKSPEALPPVLVELGETQSVQPICAGKESMLQEKSAAKNLTYEVLLPESVAAPIAEGETLGELVISSDAGELARVPLVAGAAVERLSISQIYGRLLAKMLSF